MGYMGHVFLELWRPITFEPITYLIVSIHHTVRLIDFYKDMSHIIHMYVTSDYVNRIIHRLRILIKKFWHVRFKCFIKLKILRLVITKLMIILNKKRYCGYIATGSKVQL